MSAPLHRVYLVRHGEVHNPNHLVYADLPGFDLSERGIEQARSASLRLSSEPVAAVWSSPLQRALHTAALLAAPHQLPVRVLPDLTEWGLLGRWRGISWEDVPGIYPGELEAYLEDPLALPHSPESLPELARRVGRAVELASALTGGPVVVVGHQDPLQAAVRELTGLGLDEFHRSKPGHAEIITIEGKPWQLLERTAIDEGASR
jgi:alpha-ribazole phosphatase/probable phosphoglycerate mutase